MTRISSSDQVLILLREQLRRLGRGNAARGERAGSPAPVTPGAISRLRRLAAQGAVGEEELRRSLVRAVLTEELGERLANEPALQAVVDDVFRIVSASEEGRALLASALDQLRAD